MTPSITRRRVLAVAGSLLAAWLLTLSSDPGVRAGTQALPIRLNDRDFWKLSAELSEPNGSFRSDNLLSNETGFQRVIPELTRTARLGRVYVGVGPEQNFTYIAALRPAMAFIIDVRRGNLQLHLLYKALFELSTDRVDFVARLFSRDRPEGLNARSSAQDIFAAFAKMQTNEALYKQNIKAIESHLSRKHHDLPEEDRKGIEYVYAQFFLYGPSIQYWSTGGRGARNAPTYAELMGADDGQGQARSYLASEDSFAFVKDLETRNLLVPVVGDFGGPKALRSVGKYLRDHGALVSAFYLSNVEQYLERSGSLNQFCANVGTLPLDDTSTFIRSVRNGNYGFTVGLDSELGNIATDLKSCGVGIPGWLSRLGYFLTGQAPRAPRRVQRR